VTGVPGPPSLRCGTWRDKELRLSAHVLRQADPLTEKSDGAGIDLHLTKPVDLDRLLELLRRFETVVMPGAERVQRPRNRTRVRPFGSLRDLSDRERVREIRTKALELRGRAAALHSRVERHSRNAEAFCVEIRTHLYAIRTRCQRVSHLLAERYWGDRGSRNTAVLNILCAIPASLLALLH
jgi:hypothetical protein